MLDIATGPGYLAAAAARRGARVVGIDFSSEMLALASQRFPEVEFREGDAETLPFPDECFDGVGISFGVLHFGHPERVLLEAFRVLRPQGKIAFTVWATPEKAVGLGMVQSAITVHGNPDIPLPPGPPFFRFSDRDECVRTLLEVGFEDPSVQEVSQTWHITAPDTPFHAVMRGGVRIAAILKAQEPEALEAIEKAVATHAVAYLRDAQYHVPMPCVLASARKPER
ncbi:Ubiquinone/menaquinone biosynthesis methyltransferase UbiE [Cupriavidus taiwanensis]|uniref:Ubiquinone/menaquinone biosynthesis methyltransferase UbiE n=2 Tax=Cupriavidus taiwanensis TaxID=164546 RepID=A0A7Z7NRA2_9BURK|nr:Ubiquinone/menaquinone biosynthesis methyltransferase UbiE [Cupriavidus taiwanensis]SOZ96227.1 Ubiquinone/menaquinone biosynthesis methyltransferase UbiE [Cupriavidus taiwanensis]SPC25505.1 Ubiquinone/menaquinone biosynthesis methyltransferase UbiE [Cupriavidus taiwanensis]